MLVAMLSHSAFWFWFAQDWFSLLEESMSTVLAHTPEVRQILYIDAGYSGKQTSFYIRDLEERLSHFKIICKEYCMDSRLPSSLKSDTWMQNDGTSAMAQLSRRIRILTNRETSRLGSRILNLSCY